MLANILRIRLQGGVGVSQAPRGTRIMLQGVAALSFHYGNGGPKFQKTERSSFLHLRLLLAKAFGVSPTRMRRLGFFTQPQPGGKCGGQARGGRPPGSSRG